MRDHYGVDVSPERIVVTAGSSAALLLVLALLVNRDDRILMADPNYPCNRHFVRVLEGEPVGIPVGPRDELPADGVAGRRRTGTPRTRGALIASPSNPTGTVGAARRDAAHRRSGRRSAAATSSSTRSISASRTAATPRSVLEFAARRVRDLELLQVLQHDRLAPGMAGRARAARARHREARAEPLHFAGVALAARGAGVLRSRNARDTRIAPAGVREAPRFPRARAARPGLPDPRHADGRLLRLRRLQRRWPTTANDSAATCSKVVASRSRRASTSACHRAAQHVRFAYTIDDAKLADGVARLAQATSDADEARA